MRNTTMFRKLSGEQIHALCISLISSTYSVTSLTLTVSKVGIPEPVYLKVK